MASFVGDGIVTKISFKKSYDLWGNKEYLPKDDILKMLSKRINMNLYDVIDTADGFILLLNPSLVNEHLHDLLKEVSHINFLSVNWLKRKCYLYFNSLDILNSKFKINLNEKFDLIFLDGPKGQYLKQLPYLYNLLSDNGTLFADNIYYHGWVKGNDYPTHKHRTAILRLRAFIEECKNKFPNIKLLEDGDGILIAKK